MNKCIRFFMLCLLTAVFQNGVAGGVQSVAIGLVSAAQAVGAFDGDNATAWDKAAIALPVLVSTLARDTFQLQATGSNLVNGIALVGLGARAAYLNRHILKKKVDLKRAAKLTGIFVLTALATAYLDYNLDVLSWKRNTKKALLENELNAQARENKTMIERTKNQLERLSDTEAILEANQAQIKDMQERLKTSEDARADMQRSLQASEDAREKEGRCYRNTLTEKTRCYEDRLAEIGRENIRLWNSFTAIRTELIEFKEANAASLKLGDEFAVAQRKLTSTNKMLDLAQRELALTQEELSAAQKQIENLTTERRSFEQEKQVAIQAATEQLQNTIELRILKLINLTIQ